MKRNREKDVEGSKAFEENVGRNFTALAPLTWIKPMNAAVISANAMMLMSSGAESSEWLFWLILFTVSFAVGVLIRVCWDMWRDRL